MILLTNWHILYCKKTPQNYFKLNLSTALRDFGRLNMLSKLDFFKSLKPKLSIVLFEKTNK